MSKLGSIFARKSGFNERQSRSVAKNFDPLTNELTTTADDIMEMDEDLFTAIGVQIGGENELLRNLLLDASAKASELDNIKASVSKLIDPVSKALRAFETEKSEKLNLQTILNNTRTAYGKLRNEVAELEKKAATSEKECSALRQELTSTQNLLRTIEATKAEIDIDIAARKAQAVELEARLAAETGETKILREENRRLNERLTTADKRIVTIEADLNTTRQRLLVAEDEKQAQQTAFEKASAEAAKLSRKLAETETALASAQNRIRQMETTLAELGNERSRLNNALEEANERHEHELATHRMRFDTLQARASASEKLLIEAREHLLARAEEVREFDRRVDELSLERDALQTRVNEMEADRITREAQLQEVDQARLTLMERSSSLARAFTAKEANLARAEENIDLLSIRVRELETLLDSEQQMSEQTIEELNASLRREKLERAVVEGALESCRKDFSRVMRELMVLQRGQTMADDPSTLRPANAA